MCDDENLVGGGLVFFGEGRQAKYPKRSIPAIPGEPRSLMHVDACEHVL